MFGVLPIGVKISESFTDFQDETLIKPAPITNWPSTFGRVAGEVINDNVVTGGQRSRALVTSTGAGRACLELLRSCHDLDITHVSPEPCYNILQVLLDNNGIEWEQPIEGKITLRRSFTLSNGESNDTLLKNKNNTIQFVKTEIGSMTKVTNEKYDIIVADIRWKHSGDDIKTLHKLLADDGLLILGSVDNVDETGPVVHSGSVLPDKFDRVSLKTHDIVYPHIYKETRNKHQYTISHLSVWRKKSDRAASGSPTHSAEHANDVKDAVEYYENSNILTSYDIFHFGEGLLSVKNFPLRMAEVCIEMCKKYKTSFDHALDAGSGPGRTAMELCNVFKQVAAYDYSDGFVENMLKRAQEKGITNLSGRQGDSHAQDKMYPDTKFDLIFGCNLIDRLHTPDLWVKQSKAMLSKSGLLIISSPYTWKPEHTDPDKWIGGFMRVYTEDGLQQILGPDLRLLEVQKIPFVIPDSDGTYQYTYSNCTVFGWV